MFRVGVTRDFLKPDGTCGFGDIGLEKSRQLVTTVRRMTSIPIVVTDGGLIPSDVAVLVGAGAQDYFSEPLNLPIIAERLEHLASAEHQRSVRSGDTNDLQRF